MRLPAVVLVLAVSVVAAEERPAWIADPHAAHPRDAFLVGVGEGVTREKAADKARAELAKSLGVSIEAESRASASETSDGKSSSYSQHVSDDVRSSTAKVLHGVEIAQYWQGPESHFALAVLNRPQALKVLGDKIAELDREFTGLSESLKRSEGKFARLRSGLRLVQMAKDRRRLNADYRMLNPEGKGIQAPATYEETVANARKAVAALKVQVAATGERAEQVAGRLMDGLGAYGLKAVEKSDAPCDLVVEAKAEAKNLPAENLLWFWARARIDAKVLYGSTGEVFTRIEDQVQEVGRDPGSAKDAAYRSIADKAAGRVFKIAMSPELIDD